MRRWTVLLGCFIGMSASMSAMFLFPFGLYMTAVTAELGWSRTQFAGILSLVALCNVATLPFVGWAVDKLGAMRSILLGLVGGCAGCAALALAQSYGAFILISCAASMIGGLALYPAYFTVVRGWFDRNLGLGIAVASAGVSVGVAVFSYLIKSRIESVGWRGAVLTTSAIALVAGLASLFLLVRENRGSVPVPEQRAHEGQEAVAGLTLRQALRTHDYWLYAGAFALVVFAGAGPNVHLPALLIDRGAAPGSIAGAVGAIALGSLAGRLASGLLLDRVSILLVAAVFFTGQALGTILLMTQILAPAAAALLLGMALGAELDMMGFVMARRFGRRAYARIFGSAFAISQLGLIFSPIFMGAVFDHTHSYQSAMAVFPVLSLAAIILIWRAQVAKEPYGDNAATLTPPSLNGTGNA